METEPTVFIIDGDAENRDALGKSISSMKVRSRAFATAEEFLDRCDGSSPGCVVLDLRLPETDGMTGLQKLRSHRLLLPVVVVSDRGDPPTVVRAMKAGAFDFLKKPWVDEVLREAVRAAIRHDAENRKRRARRRSVRQQIAHLSEGEREVLRSLVAGQTNREIAEELGLSVRTIEVRRAKIMRKMEAESLAHLVRLTLLGEQREERIGLD
mgnify:CR=1 FL=1